ncbi:flagellar biosynthesis anti-sigma factor FlgM [Paenibacillus brevis]|uniref:Flagellar biosynthesis anti-sigma factor FlgM n=1 Tax=Paenibacillus brevis TaxID=2841508 RepID=A0ABS6FLW9_9BACL|nr:flagellar biosynthesis anti-sigma factor FlgM [Paenibacillus brevis]MBU5670946.1 flagellar biosynthesis anti-sigma factor FlgM [Paenibacillus brevis]
MKINETGRVNGISSYQRNIENREHAVDKKKRQVDQVSISAEAKGLLEVQNQVTSPERLSRIAELKESVSTGTYHVDAKQIAEKMLPYFKSIVESGDTK